MARNEHGSGKLFPSKARTEFLALTHSRYNAMMKRLERKKLIDVGRPPFTKEEYRNHLLHAMGDRYDGFIQCRYCRGFFGVIDISADHEIPLIRRGSIGLDNIGYPCMRCNLRKGGMTPTEFLKMLGFLEREIPEARLDVLDRLEKAVAFMQKSVVNAAVIGELKKTGSWQIAQRATREHKKANKYGRGRFG
ncbi:MAG TPA: hypothetical protein VFW94_23755 [Candidatus Acidoferrales bacterium]|nr:hypothetical protein [Candidatus Acidoferrales bacterium]